MAKALGTTLHFNRCGRRRQVVPGHEEASKQNKTKQNKTKQNKTKQNKTKQNKAKQNKTKVKAKAKAKAKAKQKTAKGIKQNKTIGYLVFISGQFLAVTNALATEFNDFLIFLELTLCHKIVVFHNLEQKET